MRIFAEHGRKTASTLVKDNSILQSATTMTSKEFTETVMPHYAAMRMAALRVMGGDEAAADDVLQDVALVLWQNRDSLHTGGNIRAYCITAVRNRCISLLRRQRETSYNDDIAVQAQGQASEQADDRMAATMVMKLVDGLDEPRHTIMVMCMRGYNAEEIAQAIGMNAGTVRQHLSRARKQLREKLD